MKFIDLFAGLGGFHKALNELGHECVFASEINPVLRKAYKENWNIEPVGDIKKIVEKAVDAIPDHDILCAGFPCQPFSKAGKQEGRDDTERGTLFDEIVKILKAKTPSYFILENVPFIAKHDNEETWKYIKKQLTDLKYIVDHRNYSPHEFGVPQNRQRVFIVGAKSEIDLAHFSFDEVDVYKTSITPIKDFIENSPVGARYLPEKNQECLNRWQELINLIPKDHKIPGFPIWGMEFGATYPYEEKNPVFLTAEELQNYKGNFGVTLKGLSKEEQLKNLPSYARTKVEFPNWKLRYIKQSRKFYEDYKNTIANVVAKIAQFENQSWQKLEWNVGDSERNIYNYILQFRASGIRVKKPNFFPSIVTASTQIPIIGWEKRYITLSEGLKLQSLEGLKLPDIENAAYKALGNAVNSKIVKLIAEKLILETLNKTALSAINHRLPKAIPLVNCLLELSSIAS